MSPLLIVGYNRQVVRAAAILQNDEDKLVPSHRLRRTFAATRGLLVCAPFSILLRYYGTRMVARVRALMI